MNRGVQGHPEIESKGKARLRTDAWSSEVPVARAITEFSNVLVETALPW